MERCPKCKKRLEKKSGRFGDYIGCTGWPYCKYTQKIVKTVTAPKDWSNFTPSEYQAKIEYEYVTNGQNVRVDATAGSGKTTTLEYIASKLNGRVLILAFNKDIRLELKKRLAYKSNVDIHTFHSFGLSLISKKLGRSVKIQENKVFSYVLNSHYDKEANEDDKKYFWSIANPAIRLVSLVQSFGIRQVDRQVLTDLAIDHDIKIKDETVFTWSIDALNYTRNNYTVISLSDMVDIPFYHNFQGEAYDHILVDEAQDSNDAQLTIIRNQASVFTQFLFVGDRNQAIYEWRGALSNSMDLIQEQFNTISLSLPVTYRQDPVVVEYIKSRLGYIEHIAHKTTRLGQVATIDYDTFYKLAITAHTDNTSFAAICRQNSPLIEPVFYLLKKGIKVNILGSDIGKDMIGILEDYTQPTIDDTILALDNYRTEKNRKLNNQGLFSAAKLHDDKLSALINILTELESIDRAIEFLQTTFTDKKEGLVFCTGHRSKGLEWDQVAIIEPELFTVDITNPGNQENNVSFVAWSRSSKDLFFVV